MTGRDRTASPAARKPSARRLAQQRGLRQVSGLLAGDVADMEGNGESEGTQGGQRANDTSSPHGPDGPDEGWLEGQAFEDASYHGRSAQAGPRGIKSAAPQDGAAALQNSYRVSENAPRRIGVDMANKEFVVLDRTKEGLWHGHTRGWDQLTQAMRNALTRNGVADLRGKIITP